LDYWRSDKIEMAKLNTPVIDQKAEEKIMEKMKLAEKPQRSAHSR
jgi:hypothetical protein